jgi:transposase-like protein
MEAWRRPATRGGFSPEFKREFVEKIVIMDKTLGDLADELGIPPEVMRKWTLMIESAEMTASQAGEPFVPARRVLELQHDIEELKRVITHQAMTIQILEKEGRP